jgi:uncharacterized protein YndB with AHSA1/START domain
MTEDRVEKTIELRAPRSRVWRAISNGKELGAWFGLGMPLELVGDFVPGAQISGTWIIDGREVKEPFCTIEHVEPERALVFRWVPYEVPPGEDHAKHPTTRIEFRLEDIANGTRLTVVESGFSRLPADKQYKRRENGDGWALQLHAIAQHVVGRITVKVEARIARPVAEVLEAIVDPARMTQYFISRGSARMTSGAELEWEWADVGAKLAIHVRAVEADKVTFLWSATGTPTQVTLALEPDGGSTKITATELPFELSEEAAARAIGQTQGWTDFCCSLKAYLQHGINLRLGKPADPAR